MLRNELESGRTIEINKIQKVQRCYNLIALDHGIPTFSLSGTTK
jgi:hypothetical protein